MPPVRTSFKFDTITVVDSIPATEEPQTAVWLRDLVLKPLCDSCPVIELCASRGAERKRERAVRKKAVLKYALCIWNGRVLLQQRPHDSSLMPGMWELPFLAVHRNGSVQPVLQLRHSITTTDYTVFVHASGDDGLHGRWVSLAAAKRMALTGLARKILERIGNA